MVSNCYQRRTHIFFLLFDHFINFFYSITNRNNAVDKLLYVTSMYLFKRQLVEGCRYISHHYISQAQIQDLFPGGGGGNEPFHKIEIFLLSPYIVIFCKFQGVIGWMGPEPPPPFPPVDPTLDPRM